jgi:hypothetical protein
MRGGRLPLGCAADPGCTRHRLSPGAAPPLNSLRFRSMLSDPVVCFHKLFIATRPCNGVCKAACAKTAWRSSCSLVGTATE